MLPLIKRPIDVDKVGQHKLSDVEISINFLLKTYLIADSLWFCF